MNEMLNITGQGPATMTTREIAALVEKEHKHVLRDARQMLGALNLTEEGYAQNWADPQNGRQYVELALPRDLTMTLVTGYSIPLRKRVIDRLDELEAERAAGMIAMPNFFDPVAAARAWADQYEARLLAERTKAAIGNRREATAMNTASQAVKKANKLAEVLDRSQSYATIKRMSMLYHGQEFNWRMLKHVSAEIGVPPIDVFDANYGTVKAYHNDAWREAYALEIPASEVGKAVA